VAMSRLRHIVDRRSVVTARPMRDDWALPVPTSMKRPSSAGRASAVLPPHAREAFAETIVWARSYL
jgi:hypothetical protein